MTFPTGIGASQQHHRHRNQQEGIKRSRIRDIGKHPNRAKLAPDGPLASGNPRPSPTLPEPLQARTCLRLSSSTLRPAGPIRRPSRCAGSRSRRSATASRME
jgi:hypothetical protein